VFPYSSRLAFRGLRGRLACAGALLVGLLAAQLGLSAASATATATAPAQSAAPAAPSTFAVPAASVAPASSAAPSGSCPGQTLTQPFAAWGDLNYYTLAPGGNFVNPLAAGWTLGAGAQLTAATLPNGATATVLELPSHAWAVSAPVCVTLEDQTARVFAHAVRGNEGVTVAVSYAGTPTMNAPRYSGQISGPPSGWAPSEPLDVQPQLGGPGTGAREVRFVFVASGCHSDYELYDLYVDPRMK
jgi:hypothetical protein